ncbi:MAG: type VI secretion system tip protein VgrG, partial [Planctomycetes bacterium]|nr:type VI secretion system tip protein VgrG [Planctomycetota bacterium]
MALLRDLSRAQLAFQVADLDIDEFQVLRYRGQEGLCQLYRFEIDLATTDTGLTMESVVGKAAVLSVNTSGGAKYFHGIIGRFELTGETHDETYFRAELVPAVWLLTHRYGSRIFQNKTVPEIVSAVLTRAGIPGDRVRTSFTGTHDPREYCVQYRET